MRSVRCEACGTKALIAASQCPSCSHLFKLRDGFGELLPLAYCTACDSHYPASVGSCKWCGTTPPPPRRFTLPKLSLPLKHIGVGGLVVTAAIGWLVRDSSPSEADRAAPPAKAAVRVIIDSSASGVSVPTAAPDLHVDSTTRDTSSAVATTPAVQASQPPQPAAPPPRWVNLIARNWVVVRAEARPGAHIVASIGPDSRVRLGETQGSWRRIRSRDIVGWVDTARASFGAAHRNPR